MIFYTNTLAPGTEKLINKIKNSQAINGFYLSGGTSLALQLGHRESEDLDFFTKETFDPEILLRDLSLLIKIDDPQMTKGSLNCFSEGVKLQFLYYPYRLIRDFVDWDSIKLSSIEDIASTKLITISTRGSKKDFIDLYFLLKQYDLETLLGYLNDKYQNINYNEPHILKSLLYFNDAEDQPMPKMHLEISWEEVKREIQKKVKLLEL